MTDRPILFSAPMIRALLAGRKTQTRRVAKFIDPIEDDEFHIHNAGGGIYGVSETDVPNDAVDYAPFCVGDRMWVREAWRAEAICDSEPPRNLQEDACQIYYPADGSWSDHDDMTAAGKLRPSMFMPRWASRLTLVVTGVKVERLQDISEADAIAEGIVEDDGDTPGIFYLRGASMLCGVNAPKGRLMIGNHPSPRLVYRDLINNLHGGDLWFENPWMVALTFTVHKQNIDAMKEAA